MPQLQVSLFGKAKITYQHTLLTNIPAKAQEMFYYLLINRQRPFTREHLIDLLWGNVSPAKGKKYLRDTLWRLQSEYQSQLNLPLDTILVMENEWIYVHPQAEVWIDVHALEQAHKVAVTVPEFDLNDQQMQDLAAAIVHYAGDLMEGWYQDWCILEREHLRLIYLSTIDRLMICFEARHRYEEGILHGLAALRYDWARERTHRRLMRLYYLSGDRTTALRQYQQCQSILKEEFNVQPEPKTAVLYDQICKGQSINRTAEQLQSATVAPNILALVPNLLEALHSLKNVLAVTNPQSELGD